MLRAEPGRSFTRLTTGGDRLVRLIKAWLAPVTWWRRRLRARG